jgi:hypothetical protein
MDVPCYHGLSRNYLWPGAYPTKLSVACTEAPPGLMEPCKFLDPAAPFFAAAVNHLSRAGAGMQKHRLRSRRVHQFSAAIARDAWEGMK